MKNRLFFYFVVLFFRFTYGTSFEIDFDINPDSLDILQGKQIHLLGKAYKHNLNGLKELSGGNLVEAESWFKKALSEYPEYSDARNNIGVVEFYNNNKEKAVSLWKALYEDDNQYFIAAYNIALYYSQTDNLEEALLWIDKAYYKNTEIEPYAILKGILEYRKGNYSQAVLVWEKVLEHSDDRAGLYFYLSLAYKKMGYPKKSMDAILNGLRISPKHSKLLLFLASQKYTEHKYSQALKILNESDSKDSEIAYGKGLCNFELGNYKQAKQNFSTFLKFNSKSITGYLNLGNTLVKLGKYTSAVEAYNRGLSINPEDSDILYNLGGAYFAQKEYKKALQKWQKLEEIGSDDPVLFKWIGKSFFLIKKWDLASEYFKKVLEQRNDNETMDLLAICYFRMGYSTEAKGMWDKLRKNGGGAYSSSQIFFMDIDNKNDIQNKIKMISGYKPEDSWEDMLKSVRLSRLYSLLGEYDNAISELVKWKKKYPKIILPVLSSNYRQMGNLRKTILTLRELLGIAPNYKRINSMLGDVLTEVGEYRKALDFLEKETVPNALTFYQRGYCYEQMDNLDMAEKEFTNAIKADSNIPAPKALLAYVINKKDKSRSDEALKLWKQAAKIDSDNADVASNIGLSYYQKKDYENALLYAQRAVSLAPGLAKFNLQLGNVYAKLNRYKEALIQYRKAGFGNRKLKCSAKSNVAFVYIKQKKWNEIISEFKQDLKECDSLRYAMFIAYYNLNRYNKALFYFNLIPEDERKKNNLYQICGDIYYRKKMYKKAIDAFTLSPASKENNYNLAQCYLKIRNGSNAVLYSKKYLNQSGESEKYEALLLLGMSYYLKSDINKAVETFEEAYRLNPLEVKAPEKLAVIYYNLGEYAKGLVMYKKALNLNPFVWKGREEITDYYLNKKVASKGYEELFNKALEAHQKNNLKLAESLYIEVLKVDSSMSNSLCNLGLIYSTEHKDSLAEKFLLKAVSMCDTLYEAYYNITAYYWSKDDTAATKKWLEKSINLFPERKSELLKISPELK